MFPNLEEQQKRIQEKLSVQEIRTASPNDAITIISNAIPEIKSVKIDRNKLDINDEEEFEDLLIIALNETIARAQAVQAQVSQEVLAEMLPPGLGSLKDLFGG